MNFDEIVVKESPGLCRCCLSEGCYKDLGTEYTWMSETEIYADMLLECFDISISQHNDGPNGSSRLICEVCITRLRDACNFKKQVQESERKFVDMLARGEFQPKVMVFEQPNSTLKTEQLLETGADDAEVEYLEDMDFEDDLPLKQAFEQSLAGSASDTPVVKVKGKRGRPRKTATETATAVKRSKEDKPRANKAMPKDKTGRAISTNKQRRRNLQILFNNTTIIPFKWRSKFMCFFCGDDTHTPEDLRLHTHTHEPFSEKDRAIALVKDAAAEVKLDISDITCKICNETFLIFEDITAHLIFKHKLPYNKEIDLIITPYNLKELKCIQCDATFEFFGKLISHMNNYHPTGCFMCDHCKQTFSKHRDLQAHTRAHHKTEYNCKQCSESFTSNSALQKHKYNEHISTCNVCFKTFSSMAKRLRHMKTEHNLDDLQCGLCHKVLATKQAFFVHATKCNVISESKLKSKTVVVTEDKRYTIKTMRSNIACILNMSTALPFKYYMNKFRCFFCPKDFTECDELKQHTILEHPVCEPKLKSMKLKHRKEDGIKIDIANLSCKLCFEKIDDVDSLVNHLITEHKARFDKTVPDILQPFRLIMDNYDCPFCEEKYRYFGILLRHISKEHTGNRKICLYCGKSFRTDPNLRAHVTRYHKVAKHHCSHCDSEFATANDLQLHLGTKHGVKVAQCPECDEKFTSQYMVKRHLIITHGTGHKCTYCGKLFTKHSFMSSHVRRIHLKEKNLECTICFQKFFDGQRLKMHMVKHVGERNFHCDLCGKKFLWKKNLRGHMASHIKHGNVVQG